MSVMYESAHVVITLQLLEMRSITTPNQTMSNVCKRYIFQRVFLGKIYSDFTDLHNEKKSILKLLVIGIVSGSRIRVNIYKILLTWEPKQ